MDRGPGPGVRRGGGGEERSGEGELQVPEDLGAAGGSKGLRLRLRGRKGKDAIEEGCWCAHPAHLPKPGQHDDDGGVVLP